MRHHISSAWRQIDVNDPHMGFFVLRASIRRTVATYADFGTRRTSANQADGSMRAVGVVRLQPLWKVTAGGKSTRAPCRAPGCATEPVGRSSKRGS